jgi:hypothetical protein
MYFADRAETTMELTKHMHRIYCAAICSRHVRSWIWQREFKRKDFRVGSLFVFSGYFFIMAFHLPVADQVTRFV